MGLDERLVRCARRPRGARGRRRADRRHGGGRGPPAPAFRPPGDAVGARVAGRPACARAGDPPLAWCPRSRVRRPWSGSPMEWCSAGTRPTRRCGCRHWSPARPWSVATRSSAGRPRGCAAPRCSCWRPCAGHGPRTRLVVADLPGPQAEPLVWDPGVGLVVAHASSATCKRHLAGLGRAYSEGAALRPYIPEGSGNDAMIVLPGADLDAAAAAAALGGFANSGQLCMSAKRMIVARAVWADFAARLVAAVEALVVGDPADERTDIGPLAEGPARERARAALAEALERGGRILVGEGERGEHFTPTVVLLPREAEDIALWREESFAPLRGLMVVELGCRGARPRKRQPLCARRGGLRSGGGGRRRPARRAGAGRRGPALSGRPSGGGRGRRLGFRRRAAQGRADGLGPPGAPRRGDLGQDAQVLPVDEGLEALSSELAADPRAAPAGVGGVGHDDPPAVDRDRTAAHRLGSLERTAHVTAADIADQAVVGAVRLGDRRGRVGHLHHRDDRCEGLLVDQAHARRRPR